MGPMPPARDVILAHQFFISIKTIPFLSLSPYVLSIYLSYCFSYPICDEPLFFSIELLLVLYDYRMKCIKLSIFCFINLNAIYYIVHTTTYICIYVEREVSTRQYCIHITSCSPNASLHYRVLSFMHS